jgi:pilus assembly protein CpaC
VTNADSVVLVSRLRQPSGAHSFVEAIAGLFFFDRAFSSQVNLTTSNQRRRPCKLGSKLVRIAPEPFELKDSLMDISRAACAAFAVEREYRRRMRELSSKGIWPIAIEKPVVRFLGLALAFLLGMSDPSHGISARAADTTTVTATQSIQIAVSGGKLVRLPESAGSEFVADPSIADIQTPTPSSLFVFGKKPGRTTLFVLAQDGSPLAAYNVNVRFPQAELQDQIRSEAGASSARLTYTANGALLQGTVPNAETASRLLQTAERTVGTGVPLSNQLQVSGSPQVNLRVRVAEVSRTVSRQLGFNWSTVLSAGNFAIGLQTGRLAGATGANLIANGLNGVFGTVASKTFNGSTVLDAMANEGLVTLLAEPNLTAISGSTATFLAGGEFPIPIPQALGTVSLEYKQFGVSIAFTPTVLTSGHISVKVRPEVSQIDASNSVQLNNIQVPSLTTRRAETTVELASGQSFAIAGLIQNNENNNIQKFPWLGDVPVLGAMFRSNQFQRNQTELVIVVSPYVVQPTTPGNEPTDANRYIRTPSDAEEVAFGRAGSLNAKANPAPGGATNASSGAIKARPSNGFVFE